MVVRGGCTPGACALSTPFSPIFLREIESYPILEGCQSLDLGHSKCYAWEFSPTKISPASSFSRAISACSIWITLTGVCCTTRIG